jgi:hypothetical protein
LGSLDSSHADNDGDNRLGFGDYANIANTNSAARVHVPLNRDTFDDETPERILISKERWAIIAQVVQENPDLCENYNLILDHFDGYSWAELGERHGITRDVARGRVIKTVSYLRKRIQGNQF